MTRERERKLQTAQRRMLRKICDTRRYKLSEGELEDWIAWVQRSTHAAEDAFANIGGESWIVCQRRRKWKWAGRVARMADDRWASKTMLWIPKDGKRKVGRPMLRWSDSLAEFFKSLAMEGADWVACAQCPVSWDEYEQAFCLAEVLT